MIQVTISCDPALGPLVRRRKGLAVSRGPDGTAEVLVALPRPASLKDVVESLGIPHGEIGAVTGALTGLDDLVTVDGAVKLLPVEPRVLAEPRFLCDVHLGRLARLLRLLGFDTLWNRAWMEPEIARRGVNQKRMILSRSLALLKRRELTQAMLVRPNDPVGQAHQVVRHFQLAGQVRLMGRCSACNGIINPVDKAAVLERIPPKTAAWLDEYFICASCGKLYWEGTHVQGLTDMLNQVLGI